MTQSLPPSCTPEELIKKGFYLFPCNDKKRPCIKGWQEESSTDPAKIQAWKKKFPGCGWGVDCRKSGLFVLDDDRGKKAEAKESLNALIIEHGCLPDTFTVKTISGGYHYYFFGHGGNSAENKLGPGLDTRGDGGYVVAPCSPGYSIEKDVPIVPVPEWLIGLAGKPIERKELPAPTNVNLDTEFAVRKATEYLKTVEPAIYREGGDAHTYKVACQARDFVISQNTCLALMLEHFDSRCQPPWGYNAMADKVANAYSYAGNPLGARAPEAVFSVFNDPSIPQALFIEGNALLSREIKIDYLIQDLIETPSTGLIFGDPSSGKSFLAMAMAMAIACGTDWMGHFARPGIAVYFAGEGRGGAQRRFEAWRKYYNIELPLNRLWVSEKRIDFSPKSLIVASDELKRVQDMTGLPISASFVDTLARHMPKDADENSAKDMGAFINSVDWLRDLFNMVVAVVHHSGKMNKDTSRGSSAIRGAMDWEFKVNYLKGLRSVMFTKQKESEIPMPFGFELRQVQLSEKVHSAVPLLCQYDPTNGKGEKLTADALLAFSILQFAISSGGGKPIKEKDWQKDFYAALSEEITPEYKRQKFGRSKKKLIDCDMICYSGDMVSETPVTNEDTDD